jgi:S-methylmethionine-dependent homocysteine/selenocysteine methylase
VEYNTSLFSTAALRQTPKAIVALHRDFIKSGCSVITTASYAVTRFYLDKVGEGHRVMELAALSVELAKQARADEGAGSSVLIAGSVPPLGESYTAAPLSAPELREQYAELVRGLRGCDVFVCETLATLVEARIAVETCLQQGGAAPRVWLSFHPRRPLSTDTAADGAVCLTGDGSSVHAAVGLAIELGVEALLFNCAPPELVRLAIIEAVAATAAAGGGASRRLRIGGYANFFTEAPLGGFMIENQESAPGAGDQKAGAMVPRDITHDEYACCACEWVDCGASIVGGCCGIGPDAMAAVCRRVRGRTRARHRAPSAG